jgi:hypothetical protein
MTDAHSKDNAAKSRIISHLNADHQATLSLYLRHYNGLSAYAARDVVMTDISFNEMTFKTKDGKTRTVSFSPPMQAWSEARMRTVEMDKQARTGLGLSSIKITEYELPQGAFQWAVIGSILFASVVYVYRKDIVRGTFIYDVLLPWFPGGHRAFFTIVKWLPHGVIGIHLLEAIWLDLGWLQKHDVTRGSVLWWKWFLSAVGEGGGSIARVNAQVKRKEAEAAKRQH